MKWNKELQSAGVSLFLEHYLVLTQATYDCDVMGLEQMTAFFWSRFGYLDGRVGDTLLFCYLFHIASNSGFESYEFKIYTSFPFMVVVSDMVHHVRLQLA